MTQPTYIQILPPKPNHDHRDVIADGKFIGFAPLDSDDIRLQRCFLCESFNHYALMKEKQCAWCGWRLEQ